MRSGKRPLPSQREGRLLTRRTSGRANLVVLQFLSSLFAGSDGSAEHCAVTASLIEPCNLNDVDPLAQAVRRRHTPGSAAYAQQPAV